jgi:hypothetical protein
MEPQSANIQQRLVIISADNSTSVEVTEAAKKDPTLVRETLLQALSLVALDDSDLIRIQALEKFRRSLEAERYSTPYRLQAVVAACQSGDIEKQSLEARFYEHGGIRALAALAATTADDKLVVPLLQKLPDQAFDCLLKSIDSLKPHRDLAYLTERICRRRKQKVPSKRVTLAGPRQRRKPPTRYPTGAASANQKEPIKNPEAPVLSVAQSTVEPSGSSAPRNPLLLASSGSNPFQLTTSYYHGPTDELDEFAISHFFNDPPDLDLEAADSAVESSVFSGNVE